MRPAFEMIRFTEADSLRFFRAAGAKTVPVLHYHPELELTLVERSHGIRFIGDSGEPFGEGDLVLLGPNLPHAWSGEGSQLDELKPVRLRAIFVQFRENFLGRELWRVPEFEAVKELLRRSRHGVCFSGSDAQEAGERIRRMVNLDQAERVTGFLSVLDLLARSQGQKLLSSAAYVPRLDRADAARVNAVCRYVRTHLTKKISQSAAAALVRLSPERFSVYFHQKVGCTFPAYVNELRIDHAVQLMIEGRMSISESCLASGFKNLSNFNHRFRILKGMSPREYLRRNPNTHGRTQTGTGLRLLTGKGSTKRR